MRLECLSKARCCGAQVVLRCGESADVWNNQSLINSGARKHAGMGAGRDLVAASGRKQSRGLCESDFVENSTIKALC